MEDQEIVVNVQNEAEDVRIFSLKNGGSISNYRASGTFWGSQKVKGMELTIKKNETKNDCFVFTMTYDNKTPQSYIFSDSFLRTKKITESLEEDIKKKCWENAQEKCQDLQLTKINQISIVLFYRKLIISVGKDQGDLNIEYSSIYPIIADLCRLLKETIQYMEPSFLSGWKSPQSMDEQMIAFMDRFADSVDENPHIERVIPVGETGSWFSVPSLPSFLKGKKKEELIIDEVW